jgi:hypothetical protein
MKWRRLLAAGCVVVVAGACTLPWSKATSHPRKPRPSPTPLAAAQFLVDGKPASGAVQVTARSHLGVAFSQQVPPAAIAVTANGQALPDDALAWSPDLLSAQVPLSGIAPYQPVQLAVRLPATLVAPAPLQVTMLATVPAAGATGVQPGFKPQTPLEIVVENSGPARPQSGLQDADVVYEYLSEYSTTRMTAIYFARIPGQVGPVRSCRMVNPYLGDAYTGVTMCSGVSDGTGGWIAGTTPGSHSVPAAMEGTDRGSHYYRVGFNGAPHNLYTSGDRAAALRAQYPQPQGAYAVDPPHDDVAMGQPADAPGVPTHSAAYAYDPSAQVYLRSDHGTPFTEETSGQQIRVKTVVLLHVPFHDAGWVEDENGGAHSVWYDMLGSGPAEVYSDGLAVRATWHMGAAGQSYFDNHTPVWFTDEAGKVMLLNTGLTWIHVVGNGQERCTEQVQTCGA